MKENQKIESLLNRLKELGMKKEDIEGIRRAIEAAKEQAREKAIEEFQSGVLQEEVTKGIGHTLIGSASLGAIAATSISMLLAPALLASFPLILPGMGALSGLAINLFRRPKKQKKEIEQIKKRLEKAVENLIKEEIKSVIQSLTEDTKAETISKPESEMSKD